MSKNKAASGLNFLCGLKPKSTKKCNISTLEQSRYEKLSAMHFLLDISFGPLHVNHHGRISLVFMRSGLCCYIPRT